MRFVFHLAGKQKAQAQHLIASKQTNHKTRLVAAAFRFYHLTVAQRAQAEHLIASTQTNHKHRSVGSAMRCITPRSRTEGPGRTPYRVKTNQSQKIVWCQQHWVFLLTDTQEAQAGQRVTVKQTDPTHRLVGAALRFFVTSRLNRSPKPDTSGSPWS